MMNFYFCLFFLLSCSLAYAKDDAIAIFSGPVERHLTTDSKYTIKKIISYDDVKFKLFFINDVNDKEYKSIGSKISSRIKYDELDYVFVFEDNTTRITNEMPLPKYKVGYFFLRNEDTIKRLNGSFILRRDDSISQLLKFMDDNNISLDNFYFIRDNNMASFNASNNIKNELYKKCSWFNTSDHIVRNIQELRWDLLKIKDQPKGVMIILLNSLPNHDMKTRYEIDQVLNIIAVNNYKHLDVVVGFDGSKNGIGVSLINEPIDDKLFLKFVGREVGVFSSVQVMKVNQQKIRQIIHENPILNENYKEEL